MLESLKEQVYLANMMLVEYKLITFTWGNVSGIDRERGLVVIKPSGVEYSELKPSDLPVLDLEGHIVEGDLKPSSDTPTHLELYRKFPNIGGVTHTHSQWATCFAQAGRGIIPYGTTHGDYFDGLIPCTRRMTPEEIAGEYEKNTGLVIVETFKDLDPNAIPCVLVHSHGPFTWGKDAVDSVHHSVILEECAKMAMYSKIINGGDVPTMQQELLDKHYLRKHGANAYYGQVKK